MKRLALFLMLLMSGLHAQADIVKRSSSDICHDKNSPHYNRTKNFTPYPDLQSCLNAGGRLTKDYQKNDKIINIEGYDRSKFGKGWADKNGNCLNTRHEILLKQSTSTIDRGDNHCTIERGRWLDPYTGKIFYEARQLDADHLVPLHFAYQHGANNWTQKKREEFANDESNIFVVEASANRQKGSKGITEWLPPNQEFRCEYILRFIRVSKKYSLVFSEQEKKEMEKVQLKECGSR